jgi:hypothetical protein
MPVLGQGGAWGSVRTSVEVQIWLPLEFGYDGHHRGTARFT